MRSIRWVLSIAGALVLLGGVVLLLRAFFRPPLIDIGIDTSNTLTFHFSIPKTEYGDESITAPFIAPAISRLGEIPGIESVAATSSWPPQTIATIGRDIIIEGETPPKEGGKAKKTMTVAVTPKFFETCKIPLVRGRDFGWSDTKDSPRVAILDETEAEHLFGPDVDVLGHRIAIVDGTGAPKWTEIVGVVKHVAYQSVGQQAERGPIYLPVHQQPQSFMWMAVRTKSDPRTYEQLARSAVIAVNKDTSITDVKLLAGMVQAQEPWIVLPSWLHRQSISLQPQVAAKPTAKSANWEVTIVSASVGKRKRADALANRNRHPELIVRLEVTYFGPEDHVPFGGSSVTLDGKTLHTTGEETSLDRSPRKKMTESYFFEDPGLAAPNAPGQFLLKYHDDLVIPFTLTEEKKQSE